MVDEARTGVSGAQRLFDLLVDPTTRTLLQAVDEQSLSAKELAEQCDVSGPTTYRKVNDMLEFDLLEARTELDGDGNHYTVYDSNVDHVQISIDPGENRTTVSVTYRQGTDLVGDVRRGSSRSD